MADTFLSILSCSYGGGHRRVAETIAEAWRAQVGGRVEVVDYFTRFGRPLFDSLTRYGYYQTIRFAPGVQRRFYTFMGRIPPDSRFRRAVNRQGMEPFARYLAEARPDVICCVHWTFAGTVSDLRAAGRTTIPSLTVITDYVAHGQWIHPCIDRYAVAHELIGEGLRRRGVPSARIAVSGLPTEVKFGRELDASAIRAELGLRRDIPVVLVMAGAYANLGRIDDVARVLAGFRVPVQPIVVCANAPLLSRRMHAVAAQSRHPFRVLGYADNIHELMAASDVLVTKAGGVTVSEALVRRLPMVLYGSIPGHEESNTRFLVDRGAALAAGTPAEARDALSELLSRPDRIEAMRRSAAALGRPDAARTVVAELVGLAAGGRRRGSPSGAAAEAPVRPPDA
jgi:processive 1,2-diacylglycerol beta-glucosyltransferase